MSRGESVLSKSYTEKGHVFAWPLLKLVRFLHLIGCEFKEEDREPESQAVGGGSGAQQRVGPLGLHLQN